VGGDQDEGVQECILPRKEAIMGERAASTVYFETGGPENTERTLQLAKERQNELALEKVLVATTSGSTGALAADVFGGDNLIVVTHSTGFREPGIQELQDEHRQSMEKLGVTILTCQHAFGGVGRAVRKKFGTYEMEEIVAHTLRTVCQGFKVCEEMALMAADAGLADPSRPCLTIAGTNRGADTAIVLRPAHAQDYFDLRVLEIVCMPGGVWID
jgi:hypothetical protein